ncbi:hypothetical protein Ocin01_09808, partial [Orchesella cincta]
MTQSIPLEETPKMDLVTVWISISFLIGIIGWIFVSGLVLMWLYPFVILDSWMGSMGKKIPTLYINGNSHLFQLNTLPFQRNFDLGRPAVH